MANKKKKKETGQEYIAPKRTFIKDEVSELLPQVPSKLIRALDYWALYSIHQDMVKSGMDAETAARRYVKGYDPKKIKEEIERAEARKEREREMRRKKAEAQKKKIQARAKAQAAKAKARAARDAARAKAQAARAKARAGQQAARAKASAERAKSGVGAVEGGPPPEAYIPPVRKYVKDDLARLMPMIKRSDLTGIDYWALYTMHSEIVKYGRNPEELARKFVKGYKPAKVVAPPPPETAPEVTPEPAAETAPAKATPRKKAAKKKKAAPKKKAVKKAKKKAGKKAKAKKK